MENSLTLKNGVRVCHRPREEADTDFIFNSWLRSYQKSPANYRIRSQTYFRIMSERVERLLERSQCSVFFMPEEPTEIMGYIVVEQGDIVHWVYVKHLYRHIGLADLMMHTAVQMSEHVIFTHLTRNPWVDRYFDQLQDHCIYDPSLIETRRAA